jgi:redox-sensitive bicupin YhaK (pirin superfamily)
MEIVTYVLEGALEHHDNLGNGSIIRPGDVQRMTAGTGVVHSEANVSKVEPLHLLQIWILPERRGLAPGYEQTTFQEAALHGRLRLLASRDGRVGSVTVHQDAAILAAKLAPGDRVEHALAPGRGAWLQVARGSVSVNGEPAEVGDGVVVEGETVTIEGTRPAEVLLFDLA